MPKKAPFYQEKKNTFSRKKVTRLLTAVLCSLDHVASHVEKCFLKSFLILGQEENKGKGAAV